MSDHIRNHVWHRHLEGALGRARAAVGAVSAFRQRRARVREALAAWIGSRVGCVVYESTGPWHRAFEESLAAKLPLSRMHAMRARRFAQVLGQAAKTDAMDAWVLAKWARRSSCGRSTRPRERDKSLTNWEPPGTRW